jgi:septum formation protein
VAVGKPGSHERAVAQLRAMSSRTVVFHTALAVVCISSGFEAEAVVPARVRVRRLSDLEIEHYLRTEQPYDCAGSAKSERSASPCSTRSNPTTRRHWSACR